MVCELLAGCGNAPADNKTPAPTAPAAQTEAQSPAAPAAAPVAPDASPPPPPPVKGKLRIDLKDTTTVQPAAPPAPRQTYVPPPKPEGPSGYISRKNVVLRGSPSDKSPQTGSFNLYDTVIILETLSKDELGRDTEVPTWYKVRCKDKKTGWVEARSVTVN